MKPFLVTIILYHVCHNPNLGLVTKTRVGKGAGQEWSPGVTFHAPRSVGKCEGMNPHTPMWTPILGVGVPIDSWIFRRRLQGSKSIRLKKFLYCWQALGTYMFKMSLHDPFGHLKHKLRPRERLKVKLPIWLSTIKSRKSPWFPCV